MITDSFPHTIGQLQH